MANVGEIVTFRAGAKSGSSPGQQQWDIGGSQGKIIGQRVVNGQTYFNIDQRSSGGGTGWVASSFIGGGAPAPSQNTAQPAQQANVGLMMGQASKPTLDVNALYNAELNNPEIKALNDQLAATQAQITQRREALARAESDINDNPFYAEATRIGKLSKLQSQAQRDIENYQNEYNIKAGELAKRKADAQTKINIALKQYDISRQDYQDNMQKFNMLVGSGALQNASAQDIVQIANATGMSTSMIEGIIKKAKQEEIKPQVITTTDEYGNLTYAVIDQMTGNLINQSTIKGVGKSSGGGGRSKEEERRESLFYSEIDNALKQLQSGVPWGTVWTRIRNRFPEVSDAAIDAALGTEWRVSGAYESYAKKQAMAKL